MPKFIAILVLILLVGGAAAWLFLPHDSLEIITPDTQMPTTPPSAAPPPASADEYSAIPPADDSTPPVSATDAVQDEDIVPPPPKLNASDAVVLAAVEKLNPDVVQWLLPEDQVRKWVASINLLADGKIPVKDRPLQTALPAFQVKKQGETLLLERENYRRANALVKEITDMPPSQVAKHYAAWRPLLEQAQAELGNGRQFHERLLSAIDRVLAVRPLTGEIELKDGVLKYTYTDEQLEKASALEKALWRLGPANTLRIQNYLRDLKPLL